MSPPGYDIQTVISTIEPNRIVYDKNVYIPISEGYREAFKKFIDPFFCKVILSFHAHYSDQLRGLN